MTSSSAREHGYHHTPKSGNFELVVAVSSPAPPHPRVIIASPVNYGSPSLSRLSQRLSGHRTRNGS
ncbi:rCG60827 [Rattus norvegicus]|uniref:RCG60827 n=1 Tax=Rattus norvegicus TaxID=10116 RepID=A6JJS7_RAT|nr:rCG60827 [Rattus norvegicus]